MKNRLFLGLAAFLALTVGGLVAVTSSPSGTASAATNTPTVVPTIPQPPARNLLIGHACYTSSGAGIKLGNLAVGQSVTCRVRVTNNEDAVTADDVTFSFAPNVTYAVTGTTFALGDIGPNSAVLSAPFTVTRQTEAQWAPRTARACVKAVNFTEKCMAGGLN